MNIEVIFENSDVVVVNKPAGILVHGVFDKHGPKHSEETLVDWLLEHYPDVKDVGDMPLHESEAGVFPFRPGIVHRLDRETSGAMMIARNQQTFEYLKGLFQNRDLEKVYTALVWGRVALETGVIDKPISIRNGTVKRTVFKGKMPREAITEYAVVQRLIDDSGQEFTLLSIRPKTGRTHQIRVHLSSLGHSIVGEKLYGKRGSIMGLDRQFLHASSLRLVLPTSEEHTFSASLSDDLDQTLSSLADEA